MLFELTQFSVVVRIVLIEIMDLLLRLALEFHVRTIEHKNGTYSPLWIVEVELEATKYGLIKTSDKGTPFSVQCLQLRRWQKRIVSLSRIMALSFRIDRFTVVSRSPQNRRRTIKFSVFVFVNNKHSTNVVRPWTRQRRNRYNIRTIYYGQYYDKQQ